MRLNDLNCFTYELSKNEKEMIMEEGVTDENILLVFNSLRGYAQGEMFQFLVHDRHMELCLNQLDKDKNYELIYSLTCNKIEDNKVKIGYKDDFDKESYLNDEQLSDDLKEYIRNHF